MPVRERSKRKMTQIDWGRPSAGIWRNKVDKAGMPSTAVRRTVEFTNGDAISSRNLFSLFSVYAYDSDYNELHFSKPAETYENLNRLRSIKTIKHIS